MSINVSATSEIKTEGLVKTFGARTVVAGVSVHFRAGEVVGLLGPNGAGKTTTFYMIVGLIPATAGRVALDGIDITSLRMHERARHGIGYLPQEASVFRKLPVEENIRAIVEVAGVPRRARASRVEEHLTELSLTHVAKQKAYTLSGGERRRSTPRPVRDHSGDRCLAVARGGSPPAPRGPVRDLHPGRPGLRALGRSRFRPAPPPR